MTQNLGWIYQLTSIVFIVFCLWAAFGKYGNVKFGGADAEPEMSFFSWFCIAFTSGMGIGVGYFGVAEPMTLFMNPPEFTKWTAHSGEAAEGVLGLVYMHWCLHPYAIYTSVGVACGIIIWNAHRRFSFASAFEPLVGRQHTEGTFGNHAHGKIVVAIIPKTIPTHNVAIYSNLYSFFIFLRVIGVNSNATIIGNPITKDIFSLSFSSFKL